MSVCPDRGPAVHARPPTLPVNPAGIPLETWLAYTELGLPIVPEHTPDPASPTGCDCRKPDCTKPGKHPRTANGSLDATTDRDAIEQQHRQWPRANLGTALEKAGLVIIGPDSPKWAEEFARRGLPPTAVTRSGGGEGHFHYYYRRRPCCPQVRICKPGEYDLLAKGNAILPPSLHASGERYEWLVPIESVDRLPYTPAWLCAELHAVGERGQRPKNHSGGNDDGPPIVLDDYGQRVYRGELPKLKPDGSVERSGTLLKIGRVLYDAGGRRRLIVPALAELDERLGYRKYTDRPDATQQYHAIVDELERQGRTPRLRLAGAPAPNGHANGTNGTTPAPEAGHDGAEGCLTCGQPAGELERLRVEVGRLQRRALDQDDRLDVLEEYVHAIDNVLGRPDEELSADDKVVTIAGTRWLHTYRSKKIANGQPPTISLSYLAKVTGTPGRRVSKSLDRLSSVDPDDGAPFRKNVTRKPIEDGEGWESTLEVIPWAARPVETFRAAATYATPPRAKHGGSRAASDARWGRCPRHEDAEIIVRGTCSICRQPLGERSISAEDFEALNVQVGHSEGEPPTRWEGNPIDVQVEHSDHADTPSDGLNLQVVDSVPAVPAIDGQGSGNGHARPTVLLSELDPAIDEQLAETVAQMVAAPIPIRRTPPATDPVSRLELNGHMSDEAVTTMGAEEPTPTLSPVKASTPWRCSCTALEREQAPDGGWRCAGCRSRGVPAPEARP